MLTLENPVVVFVLTAAETRPLDAAVTTKFSAAANDAIGAPKIALPEPEMPRNGNAAMLPETVMFPRSRMLAMVLAVSDLTRLPVVEIGAAPEALVSRIPFFHAIAPP